jgi:hypothetical protein
VTKKLSLTLIIFFAVILIPMVSAQGVGSPVPGPGMIMAQNFVPVSTAQCGNEDYGCLVACMTSMIASQHNLSNSTQIEEIATTMFNESTSGQVEGNHPAPYSYQVISAAIKFLLGDLL